MDEDDAIIELEAAIVEDWVAVAVVCFDAMMKNSETSKLSSEDCHQLNQQRNTNLRERKAWENEGKRKKVRERQNERERMNGRLVFNFNIFYIMIHSCS